MMQPDCRGLDVEIDQVVQDRREQMRVEYLLHHDSEMESTEPVTDCDLVACISGPEDDFVNTDEEGDEDVFMPPLR